MEAQVVVRVAQDGLLDEEHVAAGFLDLLADAQDVLPLLPQDTIHGRVVRHHHVVFHVALKDNTASQKKSKMKVRGGIIIACYKNTERVMAHEKQHSTRGKQKQQVKTAIFCSSTFGADKQNCTRPIFASAMRVGPPAVFLAPLSKTRPRTSSVSSTVPPTWGGSI